MRVARSSPSLTPPEAPPQSGGLSADPPPPGKAASVGGEARSECHSGAPPRGPQAREACSGQVYARRTLRLTGKSACL